MAKRLRAPMHGLAALGVLALGCGSAEVAAPNPSYDAVDQAAETARGAAQARGMALGIVRNGKLVHTAGFGQKRAGVASPVTGDTRFRILSVTKVLTAIGLMELVDAGKVELDAPLVDYVPEFTLTRSASEVPKITIQQLLTHTSGLPTIWAAVGTPDAPLDGYFTTQAFADSRRLQAPPGRMWFYSNLGYDLLGLVIQRVSHEPYPQYMQQHVFKPLGMTRTTFSPDEVRADGDYALGEEASGEVPLEGTDVAWQRPSALAFSTATDLSKLMIFVMHGDPAILSPALHQEMISPVADTELYLDRIHWGLGVIVADGAFLTRELVPYDFKSILHGGEGLGNSTFAMAFPSRDFAVVYLDNKLDFYPDEVVRTALTTLTGAPDLAPSTQPEDPSKFGRYLGSYTTPGPGSLRLPVNVTLDGQRLHVERPALGEACTLDSIAPGNFVCNSEQNALPLMFHFTFLPSAEGKVEYLRAMKWAWVATAKPD